MKPLTINLSLKKIELWSMLKMFRFVNPAKLCFSLFSDFSQLSFLCNIRKTCDYYKTTKLNSETQKKCLFYKEKSFVGLTQGLLLFSGSPKTEMKINPSVMVWAASWLQYCARIRFKSLIITVVVVVVSVVVVVVKTFLVFTVRHNIISLLQITL